MKVLINIESENQAMVDNTFWEVKRILQRICHDMAGTDHDGGFCRDINGNKVGFWSYDRENVN